MRHWLGHGADAVVGTAFAVTQEGDAHENFKRVLIEADPDKLAEFTSVAGLPARAVATPWLTRYLKQEKTLQANARCDERRCSQRMDCLTQCGMRGHLALRSVLHRPEAGGGHARRSRPRAVLPGRVKLPFGNAMRSVLMDYLLHGNLPATAADPSFLRPPPGTFRRRAGFPKLLNDVQYYSSFNNSWIAMSPPNRDAAPGLRERKRLQTLDLLTRSAYAVRDPRL